MSNSPCNQIKAENSGIYRSAFTNEFGERWQLEIDRQTRIGKLTGDELGDEEFVIENGEPFDLILAAEETDWLAECWQAATGCSLRLESMLLLKSLMNVNWLPPL